jgi:hypothetical protein
MLLEHNPKYNIVRAMFRVHSVCITHGWDYLRVLSCGANLSWGTPNMLCMTGSIIRMCFVQCIQVIYYFQMSPNILQIVYFVFLAPNATLNNTFSWHTHDTEQLLLGLIRAAAFLEITELWDNLIISAHVSSMT